jgi:hypothetical protein
VKGGTVWTPARNDLLVEQWNANTPTREIFAALAALPGPPPANLAAVSVQVAYLRSKGVELRNRHTVTPAAAAPSATIPDDAVAEARERMRADDRRGARDLADYFGWPLTVAQQVAETIRAELKAAA